MPHARMEIDSALSEVNGAFKEYDAASVLDAQDLGDLVESQGLGGGVAAAIGRLHPTVQSTVLGAIQGAAKDGARPIYMSWRHAQIQRVDVTAPTDPGLPLDIRIKGRYDEDGLTTLPPSTY